MLKKSLPLLTAGFLMFGLAACDVQKTQEGNVSLPKYEVEKKQAGDVTAPKYKVETPDVNVKTEQKTVEVPTVKTEEKQVDVPTVQVTPAKDK